MRLLICKILDITGRADFVGEAYIFHDGYDVKILNQTSNIIPVTGFINEAYVLPIVSGSTVYNVVLDPTYSWIGANTIPIGYTQSILVSDYYNILIKTYQTYTKWLPFTTYELGEYITYYNSLYVSTLSSNRLNNPTKYNNAPTWSSNLSYVYGQTVVYNSRYYRYLVLNPIPIYLSESLSVGLNPKDLVLANNKTYVAIENQNKVSVIQNSEFILATSSIAVGTAPTKILYNTFNSYVYVMMNTGVDIIDPNTDTTIAVITSTGIPIDMVINDSGKLYLSLNSFKVAVYDYLFNLTTVITFTSPIFNLTWAPNNNRVYGYDSTSNIIVIDSNTDLSLLPIPATVGGTPPEMQFNTTDGYLYYIDGSSHLYKTVSVPSVYLVYNLSNVIDFIIDSNGFIYVSNALDQIVQINTLGTIISTNLVGVSGPMTIDSHSNDLYISDRITNQLVIFNITSGVIKSTLDIPDKSTKMIFDNTNNSVYGVIPTMNDVFRVTLGNIANPPFSNINWEDVTEWQLVPYKPVQTIREYRNISDLTSFNFTVDANIDPYVVTEITTDNGYGQIYTDRKNYQLYIASDGITTMVLSTDPVVSSNP